MHVAVDMYLCFSKDRCLIVVLFLLLAVSQPDVRVVWCLSALFAEANGVTLALYTREIH